MFSSALQIDWNLWGPKWLVVAVFAVIIAFVIWLYKVDGRRLTDRQRWMLLAWRVFTVVIVLLMLMEPSYKLTTLEKRPPVAVLALDESMSMSLPEASDSSLVNIYTEKDKAKRSRYAAAMNAISTLVPELVNTHRVKVVVVSDQVRAGADFPIGEKVTQQDVVKALDKVSLPSGNYSNLGESLMDVMKASGNAKVSAVVLLTDGRVTGGKPFNEAGLEAVARKMPVHTIGLGSAEALPDLKFGEIVAPPEANINDILTVQVSIINSLRSGLQAELKMYEDGSKEPVATRKIVLPLGESRNISISTKPTKEGEIRYTLKLPTFPEEVDQENNTMSFHVNVAKRHLKVLYIAGAPTMEYQHMVPTLVRDKVMTVSCFLQSADVNARQLGSADVQPLEELPRTPAQWDAYDVVVLYDVDPGKFSNEQENGLENLVQTGGGVLFIAGRVHGLASLLQVRGGKIEAMLPVDINKNQYPEYEKLFNEPFRCVRTKEGEKHPLMIFAPGREKNDEVWRSFSDIDFFWSHPVMGLKRQAVPLLTKKRDGGGATPGDTVMALMRYGKGSSVFVGINSMWKWRYPMESFDYDQFWTQMIRYLAEYRMLGSQRQIVLSTDKKIYSPGETAQVQLSILDPALANQLRSEQVFATITDEHKGEYKVPLKAVAGDPSSQRGKFTVTRIGEHEVRANHVLAADLAARKSLFDEKTHFVARMQSPEFKDATSDLAALTALAEQTGGTALDHKNMAEKLKKLPGMLDRSPQLVPHETYDDLWDRWYVLALLLLLGTLELWFRRHWGLL